MDCKNSKSYVFLFFLIFAFAFVLPLNDAGSEENTWKLTGKTKDKYFMVYYSPQSVNYITETIVSLTLKKERSQEGIEQFKKEFNASLKEAEARAGERLKDDPGPLMNILIKRETKEFTIEIDCAINQLRVPMVGIVIVDEIESGTAIENIKNEVCKKPSPDKKQ